MRAKILIVSPQCLLMKPGTFCVTGEVLPTDARFLNAWFDSQSQMFHVLIESQEWEEIKEGCCYPFLTQIATVVRLDS